MSQQVEIGTSYRVEKDAMVPMRDGQALATDLWIPDGDGPAPALLVRTPYGKDVPNLLANTISVQALLEAGYAVVFQDCRGTYRSNGEFTPMVDEPGDGADTVEWLGRQPWCDGNVGTFGASYLGWVQWATASQDPAALRAIAPTVTTGNYYAAPWYSDGGRLGDAFTYDPADPVPSVGGRLIMPSSLNAVGPVDQRGVERHDDVLCFTTPALEEPVEVTGHVSLELFVASSALDTDFAGKLVDVHPDGRAIYLTDGVLRARYRDSLAEPEPLEPERVYRVTLDLSVTSNVFLPGHRIRLEVSGSNFPRYDRNTNTGGIIAEESLDRAVVATNRVLHGAGHPSRLILPIVDR